MLVRWYLKLTANVFGLGDGCEALELCGGSTCAKPVL
jgi:hypothetical protein